MGLDLGIDNHYLIVTQYRYIDVHWSADSEKFRPPETSGAAKQAIRSMLPLGLKESISKVRNTVAFSLAGEFHG